MRGALGRNSAPRAGRDHCQRGSLTQPRPAVGAATRPFRSFYIRSYKQTMMIATTDDGHEATATRPRPPPRHEGQHRPARPVRVIHPASFSMSIIVCRVNRAGRISGHASLSGRDASDHD